MRVLLAVDGSPCSDVAVQNVITQFAGGRADVRVLHVDEWPRDLPSALAFAEGPSVALEIRASHERRRAEAEAIVSTAAQRLKDAGVDATGLVRQGDARQVILDETQEWPADLVVLGSHGRTGMKRVLLGSVSDSVSRHARCSVQIVRGAAGSNR